MNKKILYRKAYSLLNEITPLKFDCGVLCNKACCKGDENTGMYLYPGEESMYMPSSGLFNISKINLSEEYGKDILHATCSGKCDRSFRPLACRIFPLVPYLSTDGSLIIKDDPRALKLCPIAGHSKILGFNKLFSKRVLEVFRFLIEDEDIRQFLRYTSSEIDLYEKIAGPF